MVAITFSTFASTAIAALFVSGAMSAPTATTGNAVARADTAPRHTHTVAVGRGGLKFEPENIVTEIGDWVEFHFLPKNHSVVQSSFDKPCEPLDGGFFSGFFPVPQTQVQSSTVFVYEVKDDKPVWFYCAQTTGAHCQNGMSGAINQKFDGPNTLAKYKDAAKLTAESKSPAASQVGGLVIPNPNPQAGV